MIMIVKTPGSQMGSPARKPVFDFFFNFTTRDEFAGFNGRVPRSVFMPSLRASYMVG